MSGVIKRFEVCPMADDPFRSMINADLEAAGKAPAHGLVQVTITVAIWTNDNPTLEQIQLRILEGLSQTFALPDELRARLGIVSAGDQKPA